jgi:hypothetical protein
MSDVKKIDIEEFRNFGFLQEVNRQFFHPLGLALEVDPIKNIIVGIWDCRDDPEGIYYNDLTKESSIQKALNVKKFKEERDKSRMERLGYIIQPIDI